MSTQNMGMFHLRLPIQGATDWCDDCVTGCINGALLNWAAASAAHGAGGKRRWAVELLCASDTWQNAVEWACQLAKTGPGNQGLTGGFPKGNPHDFRTWRYFSLLFSYQVVSNLTKTINNGYLTWGYLRLQHGAPQICDYWFVNHEITTIFILVRYIYHF